MVKMYKLDELYILYKRIDGTNEAFICEKLNDYYVDIFSGAIMSYNIETRSITEFVTDSKIKLPRFQRRSTWSAKQNFELAISIFQEYPVGVVIINDEGHSS